jgi:hypothetical protein
MENLINGVMLVQQTPNMKVTSEKMPLGEFLTMFYDFDNYTSYGVTTYDEIKAFESFNEFAMLLN